MANEASYYGEGEVIRETAAAAVTAGQVELKAGQPSFANNDYAASDIANYGIGKEVEGTFTAVAVAANAGDPVWFDASANTFTISPVSAAGDFMAGTLTRSMAASATTGYVKLGGVNNAVPAHLWQGKAFEVITADKTLDAQDVGKIMCMNSDAKTVTLPATVAGLEFIICNIAGDGGALLSVSPNANDKLMGADVAGVDNKDYQNTKATQDRWDYIKIVGDGADGYWVTEVKGTWAQEA